MAAQLTCLHQDDNSWQASDKLNEKEQMVSHIIQTEDINTNASSWDQQQIKMKNIESEGTRWPFHKNVWRITLES